MFRIPDHATVISRHSSIWETRTVVPKHGTVTVLARSQDAFHIRLTWDRTQPPGTVGYVFHRRPLDYLQAALQPEMPRTSGLSMEELDQLLHELRVYRIELRVWDAYRAEHKQVAAGTEAVPGQAGTDRAVESR